MSVEFVPLKQFLTISKTQSTSTNIPSSTSQNFLSIESSTRNSETLREGGIQVYSSQNSVWHEEALAFRLVASAGQQTAGAVMAFFSRPQSAAVRIVKPNSEEEPPKPKQTPPPRKVNNSSTKQTADVPQPAPASPATRSIQRSAEPPVASPLAQAINAPAFVPPRSAPRPAEGSPSLTPQAAVFVPKTPAGIAIARNAAASPPPAESAQPFAAASPALQAEPENHQQENGQEPQMAAEHNGHQEYGYQTGYEDYNYQGTQDVTDSPYFDPNQLEYHPHGYEHDTSYFAHPPMFLRQPLNYLLYTPSMPPQLIRNTINTHFVPPSIDLRQILQEMSETTRGVAPAGLGLPEELQGYHTLVPLEQTGNVERRKLVNWHSTVYRAINATDGLPGQTTASCISAFAPIELWSQIQHPGVVAVKEAFTTKSFNDNSLVVVYAYHPNAKTLFEAHVKPKPQTQQQTVFYGRHHHRHQQQTQVLPEHTLWSYIVQIASAIKKVHERGQAVRMIDVSKILVTSQNRIRIGSCGIIDVLLYDTQQDASFLQQEDLLAFGRLIFILCTNNLSAANQQNMPKSIDAVKRLYSVDVQTLALYLCSKMHKSIEHVLEMVKGRILAEHDEALMATDRLEYELLGELENARLFRLVCKFGFINERPEFARDARWSETGDRYIIKLFRDYVFHQIDEHGNPVLDLGHVLTCLNKLDAGTDEKMMLVARDEQSCLVVSYKDVKTCIANAFDELMRATTASQTGKDPYSRA
ncbi:hypothetical protein NLJ89_g4116 [Agrocybe chaxingu]|uniref:PAN2-PAN3 deadenylation complex subunit PAN3 n=1 Tax=Agrocybe chaxingu TaxID=84603 RepID=A0A9W8K3P9_9AGAR|nr:hypothetical protein NLJ89_g4116 [Agrocybe chaxingu]